MAADGGGSPGIWQEIVAVIGVLMTPIVAALGFLYRRLNHISDQLGNFYSNDQVEEKMEQKVEPIRQDQQKLSNCIESMQGTLEKINDTLKQIELREARREGQEEALKKSKAKEELTNHD